MASSERNTDLETLARMAARHAGRDPDEPQTIRLGDSVVFDDVTWRYPDFMARAEAAYAVLRHPNLVRPTDMVDGLAPPDELDGKGAWFGKGSG